jgi:hypothetical protein
MPNECEEVIIGHGGYEISEEDPFPGEDVSVTVTGDCMLTSDVPPISASGNIQVGETQNCSFLNIETCEECVTAFLTEGELAEFFSIPVLVPQNLEELCEILETQIGAGDLGVLDAFRELLRDPNSDGLTDDQITDGATIEQLINCLR